MYNHLLSILDLNIKRILKQTKIKDMKLPTVRCDWSKVGRMDERTKQDD